MADPDTNYVKNSQLRQLFGGVDVGSDNTIDETTNIANKNLIDGVINDFVRNTDYVVDTPSTNLTDTDGFYSRVAYKLYKRLLEDKSLEITIKTVGKDMFYRLKNKRSVPFAGYNSNENKWGETA